MSPPTIKDIIASPLAQELKDIVERQKLLGDTITFQRLESICNILDRHLYMKEILELVPGMSGLWVYECEDTKDWMFDTFSLEFTDGTVIEYIEPEPMQIYSDMEYDRFIYLARVLHPSGQWGDADHDYDELPQVVKEKLQLLCDLTRELFDTREGYNHYLVKDWVP